MIKLFIGLSLMSFQLYAVTVLSEKTWCTGDINCSSEHMRSSISSGFTTIASVFLLNQWGYQGMMTNIGSSHSFYIYNSDAVPQLHIIRAKLCDMRNNCANYEANIRVDWQQLYNDIVYLNLESTTGNLGREPIYAYTDILYSPESHASKEANLFLQPFPYDD